MIPSSAASRSTSLGSCPTACRFCGCCSGAADDVCSSPLCERLAHKEASLSSSGSSSCRRGPCTRQQRSGTCDNHALHHTSLALCSAPRAHPHRLGARSRRGGGQQRQNSQVYRTTLPLSRLLHARNQAVTSAAWLSAGSRRDPTAAGVNGGGGGRLLRTGRALPARLFQPCLSSLCVIDAPRMPSTYQNANSVQTFLSNSQPALWHLSLKWNQDKTGSYRNQDSTRTSRSWGQAAAPPKPSAGSPENVERMRAQREPV